MNISIAIECSWKLFIWTIKNNLLTLGISHCLDGIMVYNTENQIENNLVYKIYPAY